MGTQYRSPHFIQLKQEQQTIQQYIQSSKNIVTEVKKTTCQSGRIQSSNYNEQCDES